MQVTLKLYAMLTDYLPAGSEKNTCQLSVDEGTTVAMLIERQRMPSELVHLVLLNGEYVDPDDRDSTPLNDMDRVAIWPPVAGG